MLAPELILAGRPGRISLAIIDSIVSTKLGLARVRTNARPAVFNRQVAMYLAKHVGGWSTRAIGRFYNGRDHSTVCYSVKQVELMRQRSTELAQLLEELTAVIVCWSSLPTQPSGPKTESADRSINGFDEARLNALADIITDRVSQRIAHQLRNQRPAKQVPARRVAP
jgi:Bacterial dnaA protein helix-turn-helix